MFCLKAVFLSHLLWIWCQNAQKTILLSAAEASFASWSITKSWVEWWTRPYYLKMLCKCLSDMSSKAWSTYPSTTNAVEWLNLVSKAPQAISMTHVYHMDKAVVMEYQAAQERISTTYRDR